MKKFLSLFAAMLFAFVANAAVINITNETPNAVQDALDKAATGDIIEMAAGIYEESGNYLAFTGKELTLRAAEGADVTIKTVCPVRLKEGAKAEIIGIKFDCSVIGSYEYVIVAADDTDNKRVVLKDCEFYGWAKNNAMIEATASRRLASVSIDGCYFHDCKKSVVFIENTGSIALSITNSTFANISTDASSFYAGVIDSRATEGSVLVDHCTFYNVVAMNTDYAAIGKIKTPGAVVSNSIFVLPEAVDGIRAIRDVKDAKNCLTFNYLKDDGWGIHGDVTKTDCINDKDPLFKDAANADFTLDEGSPALTMGTDGGAIGDPRWAPDEEPIVIPQYEVAEAIAAGLKDGDEVEIHGVVTKLEFKGKNFAKYGSVNVYVKDATGKEGEFEFYNCYSLNADTFKTSVPEYDAASTAWAQFTEVKDSKGVALHVGDTVIGLGKYKLFNTTHELDQGCFLVDLRPFVEVHTYTVAGNSDVLFGKAWDPKNEANDMVELLDGRFAWWQTDLKLAKGEIEFKVCKDHAWTVAYPKDNYKLAIPEDGIYTIEIYFDPAADDSVKVSAKAEKTGEAIIIPSLLMHGNFTGSWKDTDPFTLSEDSLYQVLKLELAAGDYEFGMKFDGAWKANGDTITRDIPSTSLAAGSGNMHIIADVAGEYTFVYVLATQTLDVVYPKVPKPVWENPIYKTDFFNKDWSKDTLSTAKWDAENQKVIVNIIPGKSDTWQGQLWLKLPMDVRAGYEYDLSFKAKANKTFGGTVVKYQENAEMTIIYDFEMKAGEEAIYSKENLRGVNGGNGILCLSFGYAPDSTDIELYDFAIVEHEASGPVAKFYVTGNDAFTADAGLEAAQAWHPDALPSYGDTLTVALKAGAAYQLKICVDGTWNTAKNFNDLTEKAAGLIDADGDNHNIGFSLVADGDVKIIYTAEVFKLEGNFVTEAIDNTFVGTKAVKVIVNGQLLIIREGKTFNVMGQTIQ